MKKMSKQMAGGGMASKMAALQNAGGTMDPSSMGDLAGLGGRGRMIPAAVGVVVADAYRYHSRREHQ